MHTPDWQLPRGVDRGLWDYLHSADMVAGYDAQMNESPLARQDVAFCERHFARPGAMLDLGCGTGRLARHFAARGYTCTGFDLSREMLAEAQRRDPDHRVNWLHGNMVEPDQWPEARFDDIACLFSTLGMIRGTNDRKHVLAAVAGHLEPGGTFVLHVHNRWFPGLGWRRFIANDHTMPQAYGGAPLTLHHFSRGEVIRLLNEAGLNVVDIEPVLLPRMRTPHGFLIASQLQKL